MNRPRWQKVISDLWKNKTRSLLVVASIAVGLFAVGIIAQTYLSIRRDMQMGFAASCPANIQVRSENFDQDLADRVENLPEIDSVEAVRRVSLQVLNHKGTWESVDLIAEQDNETGLNRVELLEGVWPPEDHQIVLADHKLEDLDVEIGDWVDLKNPVSDIKQLQVVGIVRSQSIGTAGGSGGFFNAPVHAYITQNTLEWLKVDSPDEFNELYATITGDPTLEPNRTIAANSVRDIFEDNQITVNNLSTRSPIHHPNQELVDAIMGILVMLGFLVVFLSAFLITNTLQSLLNQQTQQIGIMKTVGANRNQISLVYMALIFVFGLLAFLIAYPAAEKVSDMLLVFLAGKINFKYSGNRFEPWVLVLQAVLALIIPQIAAFVPILQGTSISVHEALSGVSQTKSLKKSWIDRQLTRMRGISRPMSIALRNVFRRKGRLALTLITLTLGGAVFISVFNVQVSLSNYVARLSQYFLADVNLSLTRSYRISEVEEILKTIPEIERIEAWGVERSAVLRPDGTVGDNVNLVAAPGDSQFIKPIMISGRWLIPEDQNAIVLNDQFINVFPDLTVGDTLQLEVNDVTTEWQIVGYFRLAGKIGGLAAYVNQDYLNTLPGIVQGQSSTFRLRMHGTADPKQQEALALQVQETLEAHNIRILDVTTGNRINESSAAGFSILTNFLLILAVLTALVGSIGLTGTMSMNVMDRTREIGVMRSIGASDPILMRMVLVEGLVIGWMSWLLGALLSFPISQIMSDMVTRALFGSPSEFGVTATGFVLWFVVVSLLSILASILPAHNATKLTIREVLAYE